MAIIQRTISTNLESVFSFLPVITLTGPRQSGKTTLCRLLFKQLPYVNLEDASTLAELTADPKTFLAKYPKGVIVDEAQLYEPLFSYLQVLVDDDRINGRTERHFVVTGSSNFALMRKVSQSMAGRTAEMTLLPLSRTEIRVAYPKSTTSQHILMGGYPAVWLAGEKGRKLILSNYYTTYVERDLRNLVNVKDIRQFNTFIRLCAGRIGTEFNASALSVEVGVSAPTIKSWISILEASYVIYLLPPYYANIGKRLVKSPKLYFCDTGLACWLMGIQTVEQLDVHPLRGSLYENLVINDFVKDKYNRGEEPNLYFYRDQRQHEVDLLDVLPDGTMAAYEIKSSRTYRPDFDVQLKYLQSLMPDKVVSTQVIYDSEETGME
ncbi:MAG: ATP-binding protein [Bacteroidales bacterium]|nr:ATP-binding protein [Bacteroidales bacterium]